MTSPPRHADDIHWIVADDAPASARDLLASGRWTRQAEAIKSNRRRTIYRIPGRPPLIVKQDSPPGPLDRMKALWRKAGAREYRAVLTMRKAGLPVPQPIAYAQHGLQSFCAITELTGCEKLRFAWKRAQADPQRRAALLEAITRFARTFARAKVIHPDMHTGNILVRHEGQSVRCYLVDLAGTVRLPEDKALLPWQTVGWLTHLSPTLTHREAGDILQTALPSLPQPPLDLWTRLLRKKAHKDAQRWPGRKRRLLHASSLCAEHHTELGLWRLMKPFNLNDAETLVRKHREAAAAKNLLKTDRKRQLSRVAIGDRSFVVKEFRQPGRTWWRADRRSWFCHYRLMPAELPACACYAWLRGSDKAGYLILEDVGRINLQRYAADNDEPSRRDAVVAAGKLLAWLHVRGIWHRDMKATNLVVSQTTGPMPLTLVDCDAVRFDVDITTQKRAKNLGQLIANLPGNVTNREKLRLAATYRREAALDKNHMRQLLRTLPAD